MFTIVSSTMKISIHAPVRGLQDYIVVSCVGVEISIHAPVRGLLTGSDGISGAGTISIHAPVRGLQQTCLKQCFFFVHDC